jgi:hypothetical protein
VRSRVDARRVVRGEREALNNSPEAPYPVAGAELAGLTRWRFRDITVFGVNGEATLTGFVSTFREFLLDPTPRVLWDMRECSLSSIAHGKFRWLISQLMRSDLQKRPCGRSAFLCPEDADYDMARMLIAYAEANDYGIELAVFRDIDEARRWLFDDPPNDRSG